jgi:DNA topoisomerase-6 subunit B
MVNPYAEITYIGPRGRLYRFRRGTTILPPLPKKVKPHPHGVDVETFRRLIIETKSKNIRDFMEDHFQGVGSTTANKFIDSTGIDPKTKPKALRPEEIVKIVRATKEYSNFKRPKADCLSPIGEELLETGIIKELGLTNEDHIEVVSRKPSTYLGFPFIVEAAVATGKNVRKEHGPGITIYRFANRIPLLFDESSGVVWKAINKNINWKTYKVDSDTSIAIAVHICSTKIPYKSVGKEYMADQPEVEKEVTNAIREGARGVRRFISRKTRIAREKRRLNIFNQFLPKIAEFATKLAERNDVPNIDPLLTAVSANLPEVEEKLKEVPEIVDQGSN